MEETGSQAETGQGRASSPFVASRIAAAVQMLEVFASVGAEAFDITHTNLAGEKRGFRSNQSLQQARESMPYLIPAGDRRQNNVIVRPRSKTVALIQLDDLSDENRAKIAPAACLILQTSPQGSQAWVAVENAPAGFKSRLKAGLDSDREASGAVRIAGTTNFKQQYAPNFPIVQIVTARPGHIMTVQQLEQMAVLAPEQPKPPPLLLSTSPKLTGNSKTTKWPDYQQCLDRSAAGDGKPKRTKADFAWCMIAQSWGHGIEQTAERLMQVSTKAQENGERYAVETATHAEYAARQRNARPKGRPAGKGL